MKSLKENDRVPEGEATARPTPSRLLRAKIELASDHLRDATVRLWEGPDLARRYPAYLQHLHGIVRASVPLMQAALEAARARPDDPVAAALTGYLPGHIQEELDHDEWVVNDLTVLGIPRETVLARVPPASVAAVVGAQYYWIFHHHPLAILGYIGVLEGWPPRADRIRTIATRAGLPLAAFSTILKHADLDPAHRHELDVLLDTLPLTTSRSSLIGLSAIHTLQALGRVVEETTRFGG
jgi:hypothetical protein